MTCAGCQSRKGSQPRNEATKPAQAESAIKETQTQTSLKKEEPHQFGLNVLSVQKEVCCSDSPGRLVPLPGVAVEGLTPDNWRFVLDCFDPSRIVKTKSGSRSKIATRDEWFGAHTASIERGDYGDVMTINIFEGEPPGWEKFARCMIEGRIDRAKDVATVRVISSESHEWKEGSGYEVKAFTAQEVYKLACVQGSQSPCVSVPPAIYRGVRDGSELRLCDAGLKLICTYKITAERGRP
jgi:hypothetical protein